MKNSKGISTTLTLLVFFVAYPVYAQKYSAPSYGTQIKTPKSNTWQAPKVTPAPKVNIPSSPGRIGDMFGSGIVKSKPVEVPKFNYTPSTPGGGGIATPQVKPTVPGMTPFGFPFVPQVQPGAVPPSGGAAGSGVAQPGASAPPVDQDAQTAEPQWDDSDPKTYFEDDKTKPASVVKWDDEPVQPEPVIAKVQPSVPLSDKRDSTAKSPKVPKPALKPVWDTATDSVSAGVPVPKADSPQYELIKPPSTLAVSPAGDTRKPKIPSSIPKWESADEPARTASIPPSKPELKTLTDLEKDKPAILQEKIHETIKRLTKMNCGQIEADLRAAKPKDPGPWNEMMKEKGCLALSAGTGLSTPPPTRAEKPRPPKPEETAKKEAPTPSSKPKDVLANVSTSLVKQMDTEEASAELYKKLGMNPPTRSWPKDTLDAISRGIDNGIKADSTYVDDVDSVANMAQGYTGPKMTDPAMLVKPATPMGDRGKITDVEVLDRITKPSLTEGQKDKVVDKISKGEELTDKERNSLSHPALQMAYHDGKTHHMEDGNDPASPVKHQVYMDKTTFANLDAIDPSQAVGKWDGVSPPKHGQANNKGQVYSENYGKWVDKKIFDMDKKIDIDAQAQKEANQYFRDQKWNEYYKKNMDTNTYNASQSMAAVLLKDKILDKTKLYKDGFSPDQIKIMEGQISKAIANGATPQDVKAIVQNHYKQFTNEQKSVEAAAYVDEVIADTNIQASKMGIMAVTAPYGLGGAAIGMSAFGYAGAQEGNLAGGLKEGLGYYVPGANSYEWYEKYSTGKATIKDLHMPLLFDLLSAVGLKGDIAAAKQGNIFGGTSAMSKLTNTEKTAAAAGDAGKLAAIKEIEKIIATTQQTLTHNIDNVKIISATPDAAIKGIDAIIENAKNLANSEYATLAAQAAAKDKVDSFYKIYDSALKDGFSPGKPLSNEIKNALGDVMKNKYGHDILKGGSTSAEDIVKFNTARNTAVNAILDDAKNMAGEVANKHYGKPGLKVTVEPVEFTNPPKPGEPPKIASDLDVGLKVIIEDTKTGQKTVQWMPSKDWGKCLNEATYNYFGKPPLEKFDPQGFSKVYGKNASGAKLGDAETFAKMLDFNATDPFHVESYGKNIYEAESVLGVKEELFTVENYSNTFYVKGKERLNVAEDFFFMAKEAERAGNADAARIYLAEGNRNVKEGIYQIQKQIDKQVKDAVSEVIDAAKSTGKTPPKGIPENITRATDLTKNIGKVDPYSGHIITPQEIEMEIRGLGFKDFKDLTEKSKFYIDGVANYVKTNPEVKGILEARGWTKRTFHNLDNPDKPFMTSPPTLGMRIQ